MARSPQVFTAYSWFTRKFLIVVLAVLSLCTANTVHAVTYTATLLHPAGFVHSMAWGASGTSQVGTGWYGLVASTDVGHALLWNGTAASAVDLNPAGYVYSWANAASGANQVGYGSPTIDIIYHALMWSGTAASAVDLNPAGFDFSQALGVSGASQVGAGGGPTTGGDAHALLWNGTAASAVDLNPTGFDYSVANAVSGASQVGYGHPTTATNDHALLWSGTASSAVDLQPAGFDFSWALGVTGASQVGLGYGPATGDNEHALLWSGTAASVVDLNPTGFDGSFAAGVSGTSQVGAGVGPTTGDNYHALLWNGTAASVVDLHPFLTNLGVTFVYSQARSIADDGSIVGNANDGTNEYAVLWTPVPDLPGDFNHDGTVDAADYVVWRKNPGAIYTQDDFNTWRANFGQSLFTGSAATSSATADHGVPEPNAFALVVLALLQVTCRRRHEDRRTTPMSW